MDIMNSPSSFVEDKVEFHAQHGHELHVWLSVLLAMALAAVSTAGLVLVALKIRRRTSNHGTRSLSDRDPEEVRSMIVNENYMELSSLDADLPLISFNSLRVAEKVGEGAFGKVCHAFWSKEGEERELEVAAKTLKDLDAEALKQIEKEAKIITNLDHPNIVKFFGITHEPAGTIVLLFEYMDRGDLRTYLHEHGVNRELVGVSGDVDLLSERDLFRISLQIARGLAYLQAHHFVHCDLAARNCLVKTGLDVKIADFGMSRDVYGSGYYKLSRNEGLLPIRWLPLEALKLGEFSHETDIWSFGVLLFEIFTHGAQPWFEHTNAEVFQLVLDGNSLQPPQACSPVASDMMRGCWQKNPRDRMKIQTICERLEMCLLDNAHRSV